MHTSTLAYPCYTTRDIELQLAADAYWRNRVYNQPQIWLVPTTAPHAHVCIGNGAHVCIGNGR